MADARKQLKEKICPVCGKTFIFRDHWAYKILKDEHVTNSAHGHACGRWKKRVSGSRDNDGIHGVGKGVS